MQKSLNHEQKLSMSRNGYAFLNYDQLKLIYEETGKKIYEIIYKKNL